MTAALGSLPTSSVGEVSMRRDVMHYRDAEGQIYGGFLADSAISVPVELTPRDDLGRKRR